MGFASRALVPLLAIAAIAPLPLFGQSGGLSADPSPAPACAAREAPDVRPFDKTRPEALVGRYEFTMVSAWEEAAGRWSRGELEIWRTAGGKVQGASDIDLDSLSVPGSPLDDPAAVWLGSGDLASRDTLSPGLAYVSVGAVRDAHLFLAPVVQADGSSSWLEVDSLSDGGFWGRWDSDLGLVRLIKEGRVLPNPHGTFCATRSAGALEDGEGAERIRVEAEEGTGFEHSRKNELIGAAFGVVFGGLLGQGLGCMGAETDCGLQIKFVAVGGLVGGMIGAGLGSAWDD